MTKTPITDKIQKILSVIEKVTLSNTLDTGFETSNFTKNWTQSGEDFEKFFGIDKFKKKYGDTITLDASEFGVASKAAKDTSNRIRSVLFSTPDVKNHRVSLLRVHGASLKGVEESKIKPSPYIWSTTAYEFLNEESSPFQVGTKLGDFWRMSVNSDEVSIRSSKFGKDFYFSSADPIHKLGQFLHSDNGAFPKQLSQEHGATLQNYATVNFEAFISEAVEAVKGFAKNEESLHDLDQLKTVAFSQLPSFIHDAILVGITDAANTNVYKTNRSKSLEANKIGCVALQPTQYVLAGLENIVQAVKAEDEIYLTPELIAGLNTKLLEIASASNPYMANDRNFLRNLVEAIKLRKWDAEKAARKTSTMLYFALSLMVNQINSAFAARARSRDAAKFYFGELGEGPGGIEKRDKDLWDTLISPSLDRGDAPMAILRAKAGKPTHDHVLVIEQFVIKYSKGVGNKVELGTLKQAGLTRGIHNSIYAKAAAQSATGGSGKKGATKQEYMDEFEKVQDSSSSILNANFGKDYWLQILDTCYVAETNEFRDGVFFVGIAPLFWDTVGGEEIYVSNTRNLETFKITLPYMIDDGIDPLNFAESNIMYEEDKAAAIYYDRVISTRNSDELNKIKEASKGGDPKNPEGFIPVNGAGQAVLILNPETNPKIKQRTRQILDSPEYNFTSLSEIRLDLLKELYSSDAEFQELAEICKSVIGNLITTVGSGFWSIGKKELALYNPWEVGDKIKRFVKANTNPTTMTQERNQVIKDYKDISEKKEKP